MTILIYKFLIDIVDRDVLAHQDTGKITGGHLKSYLKMGALCRPKLC